MTTLPVLSSASLIGTDARPLRASALPDLLECAGSILLTEKFWGMGFDSDTSGPAAETGSLVHHAAEAFHRGGDGLAAIETFRGRYPQADVPRAIKIYQAYAADPENQGAEVVQLEQKVRVEIDPQPWDEFGPIVVNGTLDQVRRDRSGVLRVWDIKTGKTFYGTKALDHYAPQQALYTLAAGVEPGGLICTDGYFRPGKRVHFAYKVSLEDFKRLLTMVSVVVGYARKGVILRTPGKACEYCVHKSFEGCSDFLRSHTE